MPRFPQEEARFGAMTEGSVLPEDNTGVMPSAFPNAIWT